MTTDKSISCVDRPEIVVVFVLLGVEYLQCWKAIDLVSKWMGKRKSKDTVCWREKYTDMVTIERVWASALSHLYRLDACVGNERSALNEYILLILKIKA